MAFSRQGERFGGNIHRLHRKPFAVVCKVYRNGSASGTKVKGKNGIVMDGVAMALPAASHRLSRSGTASRLLPAHGPGAAWLRKSHPETAPAGSRSVDCRPLVLRYASSRSSTASTSVSVSGRGISTRIYGKFKPHELLDPGQILHRLAGGPSLDKGKEFRTAPSPGKGPGLGAENLSFPRTWQEAARRPAGLSTPARLSLVNPFGPSPLSFPLHLCCAPSFSPATALREAMATSSWPLSGSLVVRFCRNMPGDLTTLASRLSLLPAHFIIS